MVGSGSGTSGMRDWGSFGSLRCLGFAKAVLGAVSRGRSFGDFAEREGAPSLAVKVSRAGRTGPKEVLGSNPRHGIYLHYQRLSHV